MKVLVDTDLCEANAICMEHCAEIFRVEDDDTLTILKPEIEERLRPQVERAVDRCPRQALRIEG